MKLIYTTALAAFFTVFFPHFASAQECEVKNDFSICVQPEPLVCDSASDFESPNHFAESLGGVVSRYGSQAPGLFLLVVAIIDDEGKLKRNLVFRHTTADGQICLAVVGEPLGEAL